MDGTHDGTQSVSRHIWAGYSEFEELAASRLRQVSRFAVEAKSPAQVRPVVSDIS